LLQQLPGLFEVEFQHIEFLSY